MKERIISITLLLILITPVMTICTYLQFEKSAIRHEIKSKMIAGIDRDELVHLKFLKTDAEKQLHWEHSKEFEYNGQMYDVVSKEVKGDSVIYICWWDYEETHLNKKLQKMVATAFNQDKESQEAQQNLINYLYSFFCTKPYNWEAAPFYPDYIVVKNTLYSKTFTPIGLLPPTPPPKLS